MAEEQARAAEEQAAAVAAAVAAEVAAEVAVEEQQLAQLAPLLWPFDALAQ